MPLFPSRNVLGCSLEQNPWNLSDKALANIQPCGLGINPWKAGPSPQPGQGRAPPGQAGHLSLKERWGHWWLLGWESPSVLLCPQQMTQRCLLQIVATHTAPQDSFFSGCSYGTQWISLKKNPDEETQLISQAVSGASALLSFSPAERFCPAIEFSFAQTQEGRQRIMKPCIPLASKCSCGGKGFFWR